MTDNFDPETGEVFEEAEELTSLEQFKQRLLNEKNTVIFSDDPICLLFPMHDAFLEDYETLIEEQNKKLGKFLKNAGNVLGKSIEKTFNELKDKAVFDELVKTAAQVQEIQTVLNDAKGYLKSTKKAIFFMMIATWVAVIPIFIVLILLLLK